METHDAMQRMVTEISHIPVSLYPLPADPMHHNLSLYRTRYINQLRKLILPINARRLPRLEAAKLFCRFFGALKALCYCDGRQPYEDIVDSASPRYILDNALYNHLPQEAQELLHNTFEDLISELRNIERHGVSLLPNSLVDRDGTKLGLFVSPEAVPREVDAILTFVVALLQQRDLLRRDPRNANVSSHVQMDFLSRLFCQLERAYLLFVSVPVEVGDDWLGHFSNAPDSERRLYDWVIDTGASGHACSQKAFFTNYRPYNPPKLIGGVGTAYAMGNGDVTLVVSHNGVERRIVLDDVDHIPSMSMNLISVWKMNKALGTRLMADTSYCEFYDKDTHEVVATGHGLQRTYWLDPSTGLSSLMH